MGKTTLVCYADSNMVTSQRLCILSAKQKAKIEHVQAFTPFDFDPWFYSFNKEILEAPQRGGGKGFWLFKPYFCEQAVRHAKDGEYIVYADSGVEFISDNFYLLLADMERTRSPIFLFGNNHNHIAWCKKEVLKTMLATNDLQPYRIYHEQVQASVIIFKVTPFIREFCKSWLAWSQIPGFIDDTRREIQHPEFIDHRNDQSILTNLAIRQNIPLHWWPTQYGHYIKDKYQKDNYPQLFYHHRYRETDWKNNGMSIEAFMQQDKRK